MLDSLGSRRDNDEMYGILRWFLVASLPFIGLFVGSLLTPAQKAQWEVTFPFRLNCLGFVDNGQTFVLNEFGSNTSKGHPGQQAVVGIDTATGAQRFRLPIPKELREMESIGSNSERPFSDGSSMLLLKANNHRIVLYDWKRQEIVNHYQTDPVYEGIEEVVLKKKTLCGYMWKIDSSGKKQAYLVIWDIDLTSPKHTVFLGELAADLRMSEDGSLAAIRATTKNATSFVVLDTINGAVLQKFPDSYRDVKWSHDLRQMYAVTHDPYYNIILQTYSRLEGSYVPSSAKIISAPGSVAANSKSSTFDLTIYLNYHPLRAWANGLNIKRLDSLINRVFPSTRMIALFEADTGKQLKMLRFSEAIHVTLFFVDTLRNGCIIPHKQTLAYWSFTTVTTWPKWIGLFLGVLVAGILVWKNLQLRVRNCPL